MDLRVCMLEYQTLLQFINVIRFRLVSPRPISLQILVSQLSSDLDYWRNKHDHLALQKELKSWNHVMDVLANDFHATINKYRTRLETPTDTISENEILHILKSKSRPTLSIIERHVFLTHSTKSGHGPIIYVHFV